MTNKFKLLLAAGAIATAATMAPQNAEAAFGTGNATATVLTPLTVTPGQDLVFGSFETGVAGTVTVSPLGTRTSTGVVLATSVGIQQGTFTVAGTTGAAISMPAITGVTLTDGANSMALALDLSDNPGSVTGGSFTMNVGGTLTVGAGQAAGSYTGTYTLTVNYN